jgi:gluconokinase
MTVIVAGVSGSGKTTVGEVLAGRLGWLFVDGDSLHPAANIAKMARGIPLTDADREPWLRAIGDWMDARQAQGQRAIVACSALKRRYRAGLLADRPWAAIAFLLVDFEVTNSRLAARQGHFFDPELLASQFAALEPPAPDEPDVIGVPVLAGPDQSADQIVREFQLAGTVEGAG